jgi:hypothetical protein
MSRQCGTLLTWVGAVFLLTTGAGCALHRCDFEPGQAVGVRTDCDPHSARVYHHRHCCGPIRDPRIPGPKIVSTLPAVPEMAAPGYFNPVPTYPVFGPRSEEPDGIEAEEQPLAPGDGSMTGESLPEPRLPQDGNEEDSDEPEEDDEPSALKLSPPDQSVRQAGWKPARKQAVEKEMPTRPCAKCTVTFKQRSSSR